jgi:hypothetical protein
MDVVVCERNFEVKGELNFWVSFANKLHEPEGRLDECDPISRRTTLAAQQCYAG